MTERDAADASKRPSVALSVLVPIYNAERYLDQCLDSLRAQTFADLEVVAIDDGSTDASPSILARHAAQDGRIRVIAKRNTGYGDSMNRGIGAARGQWVGICEPDDFCTPVMFERLYKRAAAHGGSLDVVKGAYCRILARDDGVVERKACGYLGKLPRVDEPFALSQQPRLISFHPSIWTALYRREFLNSGGMGGRPIRFLPIAGAGWSDNPFMLETLLAAKRIAYVDEPLYCYWEEEDGTISHLGEGSWDVISSRWFDMQEVVDRYRVEDRSILEAHWCRGCAYIQMLVSDFGHIPAARAAAKRIAKTMDYNVVYDSRVIPQDAKDAYQDVVGRPGRLVARVRRASSKAGVALAGPKEGAEGAESADLGTHKTGVAETDAFEEAASASCTAAAPDSVALSVLVPIYNAERYLDQCLDSLRAQTFAELEVVAIDDGSTDASPSILARHAAQDGRIRVIAKRNTGYGDSMNRGIEAARGQWVGICEPDDFVDANAFATYLAASRLSDDVDIVKANHYEFSGGMQGEGGECAFEGGSSVVVHNYDAFPSSVPFPAESRPDIVRTIPAIWAGIYRKSMLDAHSVRFSPTPGASFQDTAFLLQAWMAARSVVLLHDAFARYRTDNDSSSSVSGDKVFAVCDEFEKSFEALRSYGSAKQLLFEPQLHAQRMEAYYWNYNRIDPAQHLAFTRRWADELAQAQDRGMLHRDLFSHESWEHVQELLADPEAFCAKHPHHV